MRPASPVLAVALALAVNQARADLRLYVDADAPPGGDGTSWAAAFNDLQDALGAASIAGEPVEIWVAAGVYRPDRGTGDRSASFGLLTGVAIYGGFAGDETDLSERDPAAHRTTLSGDLRHNDQPGFFNYADNSVHVATAFGVDQSAVLDGFTITGGNANIDGGDAETRIGGGGLFADEASPTIVGCTFDRNSAGRGVPTTGFFGGGVFLRNRLEPMRARLERCAFAENRSVSGGALGIHSRDRVLYQEFAEYDIQVIDCEFFGNSAQDQLGGAVATAGSPFNTDVEQTLNFERCRFVGNFASYGGALVVQNPLEFSIVGCDFVGNSAGVYAGALWHIQTAQTDINPARIVGCTFEGNFVGGPGGALLFNSTAAEVIGCSFAGNFADAGAAIFTDGYTFGCGQALTVINSEFSGNVAGVGAVYVACSPRVVVAPPPSRRTVRPRAPRDSSSTTPRHTSRTPSSGGIPPADRTTRRRSSRTRAGARSRSTTRSCRISPAGSAARATSPPTPSLPIPRGRTASSGAATTTSLCCPAPRRSTPRTTPACPPTRPTWTATATRLRRRRSISRGSSGSRMTRRRRTPVSLATDTHRSWTWGPTRRPAHASQTSTATEGWTRSMCSRS